MSERAGAWYRVQSQLAQRAAGAVMTRWAKVDPESIRDSWRREIPGAVADTARVSLVAASGAQLYVTRTVEDFGEVSEPAGVLRPERFVDPAALSALLMIPQVRALQWIEAGRTPAEALRAGGRLAGAIAAQQTRDTARDATGVAIVAEAKVKGWLRRLQRPSCGRCEVLAGRVYKWSDGFLRHPGCDCVHVPWVEGQDLPESNYGGREYFDRLSTEEQNRLFGRHVADRIREIDPDVTVREQTLAFDRAVNSDRSLWRSRYQPRRTAGDLPYRTTDWYMDQAGGDRAKAVALMKDAGLLDSGGHRVFTQSASDKGRKLADGTPSGGRITESRIKRLPPTGRGGGGGGNQAPPGLPPGVAEGWPPRGTPPHVLARAMTRLAEPWVGNLSQSERQAFTDYALGGHRDLNRLRRLSHGAPPPRHLGTGAIGRLRRAGDTLDAAISRAHGLPAATELFRGVRMTPDLRQLLAVTGEPVTLLGFNSTSISRQVADRFGDATMRLTARPGVRGAWLPPISDGDYRDQLEFLLRHGARILVVKWGVGGRRPFVIAEVLS